MIYVFDLDGTLIDSSARHGFLLKSLLERYDLLSCKYSNEKYIIYKRSGKSTITYLTEELGISNERAKEIAQEWVNRIEERDLILNNDVLFDDAMPILKLTKSVGRIIFVTCRKSRVNLIDELNALQISQLAEKIIICDPDHGIDEKTAAIREIKDKCNDHVTVVGDTEIDYEAAIKSGSMYYLLNRGFRSKEYWDGLNENSYGNLLSLINYEDEK